MRPCALPFRLAAAEVGRDAQGGLVAIKGAVLASSFP